MQAKSIAKQKAEQLNERLNYMPSELLPGVETETELQYFEEEIEINDFPQQIRYKICSRVSACFRGNSKELFFLLKKISWFFMISSAFGDWEHIIKRFK